MGTLYVVGLGPGDPSYLTGAAKTALSRAEVLCGYTLYVELIRPLFPDKEIYTTAMTGEIERCRHALDLAQSGRDTAMVCSGDAGVYGMAAPVVELLPDYPGAAVEIVPGVTAALSGAALLGAPLGHDFCVISLSDRLTDWSVIERRLECAAAGDFALCLYNPASNHRRDYLRRACEILLREKTPDTVCGMVRSIGRAGESVRVLTLSELRDADADMFTTVFVGSSQTRRIGKHIVTPRGYRS